MNEIIKMIVEDDNLFKIKNDGTLDPLSLEKLTKQRRAELRAKIDNISKENAERIKEQTLTEFHNLNEIHQKDFNQKLNNTAINFHLSLDSNLNRFEQDIKETLKNIEKPLDLLDTSYVEDRKSDKLHKIFDIRDYMRYEMEDYRTDDSNANLPQNQFLSVYDLKNFEHENPSLLNSKENKTRKQKIVEKSKELWKKAKEKIVCFKKLNQEAFSCFKK